MGSASAPSEPSSLIDDGSGIDGSAFGTIVIVRVTQPRSHKRGAPHYLWFTSNVSWKDWNGLDRMEREDLTMVSLVDSYQDDSLTSTSTSSLVRDKLNRLSEY